MIDRIDRALLACVHELDPTGQCVVYIPARTPGATDDVFWKLQAKHEGAENGKQAEDQEAASEARHRRP